MDLGSVFEKNCTEDDYKRWSPSDNTIGKHRSCLLGRKEVYERRVVNANCYNGRNREKLVTSENCVCDRSDYQCDFGFHRDQDWSGACVRDPLFEGHDYYRPPGNCRPGYYLKLLKFTHAVHSALNIQRLPSNNRVTVFQYSGDLNSNI